ncbi:MAG: hypothetical protein J7J91_00880 [Deltaproteobacteria bacterium]|nr:hypothetical protein [Deltaproteobacteria bacterium]
MVVIYSSKLSTVVDLKDVRCFWIIEEFEGNRIEFSYSGRKVADVSIKLPADVDSAKLIEFLARAKNDTNALEWERLVEAFKKKKEEGI